MTVRAVLSGVRTAVGVIALMVAPAGLIWAMAPLVGWEVKGEEASSLLPLPNMALVVARPRPAHQVGPGWRVLTKDGLFQVLMVQRAQDDVLLLAQRESDGAALSMVPGEEVLKAEVVVPYMGYGLVPAWWGRALLLAPGVWVFLLLVRPEAWRRGRRSVAPELATSQAPVAPLTAETTAHDSGVISEGSEAWPVDTAAQDGPEEKVMQNGGEEGDGAVAPAPGEEVGLDGALLDIFRRVSQEVRERTLAAEVEDVDIASLLQELRDMRRILGRRSS
jgi:hypothetical protein